MKNGMLLFMLLMVLFATKVGNAQNTLNFKIVDSGQETCYDLNFVITPPSAGEVFFGQDAHYNGYQPSYTDNGDGTITDNVTGLMWQKTTDQNGDGVINYDDKMSYEEAFAAADTFSLAGYNDWRLPSIKEQYSLILFSGVDPSGYEGTSTAGLVPFIDTNYFDFGYGDLSADERLIDAQYATSTLYVSTTMMGDETMFGVNFADGRIKGYGIELPGQSEPKRFYVSYVRGNTNYGINDFENNGDGTITDHATGLMWMQTDNAEAILWQDALEYAETAVAAGYDDWRLPNAKELQSIIDYTRSPATTNSAAIDPVFNCSTIVDEGGQTNYPFYWTSTTHANWTQTPGKAAAYVCFGEALGWMEMPPNSGNYNLLDVHGAGAQRSDFKSGDPNNYPHGHGPQGDVVRIFNFVRLVRDDTSAVGILNHQTNDNLFNIELVSPNPASTFVDLEIKAGMMRKVNIQLLDMTGKAVLVMNPETCQPGNNTIKINVADLPAGIYFMQISSDGLVNNQKIIIR